MDDMNTLIPLIPSIETKPCGRRGCFVRDRIYTINIDVKEDKYGSLGAPQLGIQRFTVSAVCGLKTLSYINRYQ